MSFLTQMVVGQYVPGDSLVHRLNPLVKVVLTLFLTLLLFVFGTPAHYLVFLGVLILVFGASRLSLGFFLRGLKPILFLILFTFLIHVFLTPGRPGEVPLLSLGPIQLSRTGIAQGVLFASRLAMLVGFTTLLTLTTSTVELTFAIERLLGPLKRVGFPASEFAMMLTIALRFIPVLFLELDKITKAQRARGVQFDGPIKERVQDLFTVLIPLFLNTFQRAFDLAAAMEVRCYEAGKVRGHLRRYPVTGRDGMALLLAVVLTAILVVIPR